MLSDTDKPVADVSIDANELVPAEPSGGGSFDGRSSDKDGKLTLKLPPGKYKLRASPPLDINYIRTEQEITVDESPVQQPVTAAAESAAVIWF